MTGTVESRTNKVGHACIDDDKLFMLSLLDIETACNERTALPHDSPAEFEVKTLPRT